MSTKSAESRENSPDASPEKRTSKKRKVLSCYACRNRKMKCDRIYPVCGRCQKTGRADQCTYDPRLLEDLPTNGDGHPDSHVDAPSFPNSEGYLIRSATSDALSWKLRVQERRIELLEKKLAGLRGSERLSINDNSQLEEPELREEMVFRGKAFKTQFYGSTAPLSALTQFTELQAFTADSIMASGNVGHVRDDFRTFRVNRKIVMKEKSSTRRGYDSEVFALLPNKGLIDSHAVLYFQVCETSYRILHEPSFWKDYHAFWARQANEEALTPFAAILLYIMAITKCLKPKDDNIFIGDSSADRDDALEAIETCDTWLQRQSKKQTTITYFQLHCLSVLAKRVNCLKLKQDWISAGEAIRLAIACGLHRNPNLLSKGRITEYEKEMRKRLWVTIVELEFQSSIDCGMVSSACGLYSDVQPPSNLPDDAFASDTQQIPAERPIEHFTPTSYASVTSRSLSLRLQLLQLLNNPTTELRYPDVLDYDTKITAVLAELPKWADTRAVVPTALLELQLRQFLLILHRPYAKLGATNQRFSYSFTACIDAASTIISLHEQLITKGILFLNHLRNDILRTALVLAQITYYNSVLASPIEGTSSDAQPHNTMQSPDSQGPQRQSTLELKIPQLPIHSFMATTLCNASINLLEKARQLFEHKVMRLGTGYMEYLLICAAQGIMPSTNQTAASIASITLATSDDLRSRGRKALERVTALCFRVLALQKDPVGAQVSSLRNNAAGTSPVTLLSSAVSSTGGQTVPTSINGALPSVIPGPNGIAGALADGKGIEDGTFDVPQDMQFELTGWDFPDFWSFDMDTGAEFLCG